MKKIISISMLLVIVLCSAMIVSAGSVFPDVADNAWYSSYVSQAVSEGIVEGYPDGTFKPDNTLKYAEFIAMMVEQQTTDERISQANPGNWGVPYYNMGLKLGYFTEVDIPIARLMDPIPRRDMAVIAAGFLEKNAEIPASVPYRKYADMEKADPDEYFISLCSALEVLEGYTADNTFRPEKTLKRSEAVKVAVCCMDLKNEKLEKEPERPHVPVEEVAPDMEIIGYGVAGRPTVNDASGVIPKDRKAVMDQILSTMKITKENGKFYFCYEQPKIDDNWVLKIQYIIYGEKSVKIDDYGNMKGGWIMHPEYQEEARKAQIVKHEIKNVGSSLDPYSISIELTVTEVEMTGDYGGTAYYLWVADKINPESYEHDYFNIMAGYDNEGYWEYHDELPEGFIAY